MPTLLLSFKRNSDSSLLLHGTLTPNERQSEKEMEQHAGVCPKFGPARRAGDTIEVLVEVDTIPEFTQEEIEDWVDDLFDMGDDEDEEEDDDEPETEPEEEEEEV